MAAMIVMFDYDDDDGSDDMSSTCGIKNRVYQTNVYVCESQAHQMSSRQVASSPDSTTSQISPASTQSTPSHSLSRRMYKVWSLWACEQQRGVSPVELDTVRGALTVDGGECATSAVACVGGAWQRKDGVDPRASVRRACAFTRVFRLRFSKTHKRAYVHTCMHTYIHTHALVRSYRVSISVTNALVNVLPPTCPSPDTLQIFALLRR